MPCKILPLLVQHTFMKVPPMFRRLLSPALRRRLAVSQGFTVAEMILVVSIMAILITITAGPVVELIRQRDVQQERNIQIELQKALQSYVESQKQLPVDAVGAVTSPSNWFNALARYTNLSPNQIRFDVWGNERRYIRNVSAETMLGTTVPVYYATIISAGANNKAESGTNVPATATGAFGYSAAAGGSIGGYQAYNNAGWWRNKGNFVQAFSDSDEDGDDIMMRFTDYPSKVEKYNLTLERLNRIAEALETFNKANYAEAIKLANTRSDGKVKDAKEVYRLPENLIYYPMGYSSQAGASTPAKDNWANYFYNSSKAMSDAKNKSVATDGSVYNGTGNVTRWDDMVALMRALGLPDSDCCSALDSFMDGTVRKEMPFYYSGNPRPRDASNHCGARPKAYAGESTLPARVSIVPVTTAGSCY